MAKAVQGNKEKFVAVALSVYRKYTQQETCAYDACSVHACESTVT